jgi:ribosomal protein L32
MDLKAMFPNLNTMWVRWSAYEIADYHGISYLIPSPGSEAFQYNCAEQPEILVANALELGRQITENADDVDRACAAFAARHGLLGLGGGKDAGPFSSGSVAPCYRPVNEKDYGEELEHFKAELQALYRHFVSARDGAVAYDTIPAITGSLSYKLTSGQTPQLVWKADSLLNVLRLAYAALITAPSAPLKVCKNCGKVYYNHHAKSEFCGTKCRNYYNVKAFRLREQ